MAKFANNATHNDETTVLLRRTFGLVHGDNGRDKADAETCKEAACDEGRPTGVELESDA
jgi:hypothetical protein